MAVKDISDKIQNFSDGHSSKKLAAWFAIIAAAILSWKYADDRVIVAIVLVWLGFAALCFGLTNITELAKLRDGTTQSVTNSSTQSDTTTIKNSGT